MAESLRSPRSRTLSSSSSLSIPSTPVTRQNVSFEFSFIDGEEIFKVNTIEEIKDAEKKIKGEIEKKKEDLRSMVGERYRDLIDAADTIKDMGQVTNQVFKGIVGMQKLCSEFEVEETIRLNKISVESEVNIEKDNNFYELATQMELLVDTPEKIWSALDQHEYLMAAQLYLLADHIVNNSLKIETNVRRKDVFAKFPILHHQWAAISHFKASILKDTRSSLKDVTLPDKNLSESLCSIILLENSSVREAFMEFLLSRKSAIQDVFHPSKHTISVKNQVCNVARLLHLTLLQIYHLFMPVENEDRAKDTNSMTMMNETLTSVTAGSSSNDEGGALQDLFGEDFDVLTVARHLPQSVLGFRPKLRTINLTTPIQSIQNNTKEWLARCIDEVKTEVTKLLAFVKTIKGIAAIRDAVYDILKNFEDNRPAVARWDREETSFWDRVSEAVLGYRMCIWVSFFRDVFIQRIEAISKGEFDSILRKKEKSIFTHLEKLKMIEEIKGDYEDLKWDCNVGSYLWYENPSDIPTLANTDEMTPTCKRGLILKAKSQTAASVRLCTNLDTMVKTFFDDVACYLRPNTEDSETNKNKSQSWPLYARDNKEPFDKLMDSKTIEEFCRISSEALLEDLGKYLTRHVDDLHNQLLSMEMDSASECLTLINRILFLGRLGVCIPDNCPSLAEGVCAQKEGSRESARPKTLQKAVSTPKVDYSSLPAFKQLRDLYSKTINIWKNWLLKRISMLFKESLYNEDILVGFGTTGWDEVSIQEETEAGQPVESKIHVPSQLSFTLSSLLFRLTQEINRVGGQILSRSALKSLSLDMGQEIMSIMSNYVDKEKDGKIWQERALQFLFDVQFLVNLLTGSGDTKDEDLLALRERANGLREKLEHFVDPFDLDVFLPYLNSYVTRQLQRSWLILGILSAAERSLSQSYGQRLSLSSHEQHGVLPTNPTPVRFILLPVSAPVENTFPEKEGSNRESKPQKDNFYLFPLEDHSRLCCF